MTRVFGYARVSTASQKLEPQIEQIQKYCKFKEYELVNIYDDKLSGKTINREGFQKMLELLKTNQLGIDAIVVYKLDRVGRSLIDLINIAKWLSDNNIGFVSIAENIDTTNREGRLFFHIMGSLAEYERELILERTSVGRDYAMKKGTKFGRKPKELDLKEIKRQIAIGIPKSKIIKQFGVSRATLYNKLKEERS